MQMMKINIIVVFKYAFKKVNIFQKSIYYIRKLIDLNKKKRFQN